MLLVVVNTRAEVKEIVKRAQHAYTTHNDSLLSLLDKGDIAALKEADFAAQVELKRLRGIYHFLSGDHAKGLKILLEGTTIGEQHKIRKELILTYYELGTVYSRNKNLVLSREYLDKGLRLATEYRDTALMADANNRIGVLYENKHALDSALFHYRIGYELNKEAGDSLGLSYSLENMATVYGAQHRFDLSIPYLKQAVAIREAKNDRYGLAIATINISESYKEEGILDSAIFYAHKAIVYGREVGFLDLLQHVHGQLAEMYKTRKQFDSALFYLERFVQLKDSIFNSEKSKQIAEMSTRFETEKKEQQIKTLSKQRTIQRLGLTATVLLLIIVVIIAYVIYRTRRLKEAQLRQEAAFQLQLREAEARNAMQQERLRISRELHDNIGAHLTFINATVDELAHDEQKLSQVKELTNETIRELRKTVWLINKPSIRLDEFVLKLRDFLKNVPHLQWSMQLTEGSRELSSELVTELFRCTQEAVNNAVKYSGAEAIAVRLEESNNLLSISIEDSGKGFDVAAARGRGFGLQNMEQRMQALGGTFHLESTPGTGTRLQLSVRLS